jgi:hypothetical protein
MIDRKYLEWVIKVYGPNMMISNSNCQGRPTKPGDYSFNHGTAQELLDRLERTGKKEIQEV